MHTEWSDSRDKSNCRILKYQVVAIAYADNTTFVASSKHNLQAIINKAQEFYDLNEIEINRKKSELSVINRRSKEIAYQINLGSNNDEIQAKNLKDTVRLLGVWIGGKEQRRSCKIKLQWEVRNLMQIIRHKKLLIEQIRYLNNRVLLLRLEYRSMIYLWLKQICDKIH